MNWLRVNSDLLNNPMVQLLSAELFRSEFLNATRGQRSVFDGLVRVDRGRLPASQWARLRTKIFRRDNYTCQYCQKRGGRLECDHVIPVSRGGSNHPGNLKTSCFRCNRNKRSKTLKEWNG